MLDDSLDLVVHVGDYIYESSWGTDPVRHHEAGEPFTLDDYRARYARYRSDRISRPRTPTALGSRSGTITRSRTTTRPIAPSTTTIQAGSSQRRAAAYKAYYEHMPLPRSMVPFGPSMPIHTRLSYGNLAEHLSARRSSVPELPALPTPGAAAATLIENCKARLDPNATMLGPQQESWLEAGLDASKARWNLLTQQTLMAQADVLAGPGERFYSDGWDGYPAARKRLLGFLGERKPANPVVLGGDVHSFWVNDLKPDFNAARSPTVASEFVGDVDHVAAAAGRADRDREGRRPLHPFRERRRIAATSASSVTPERLDRRSPRARRRAAIRSSACSTLATFVVENGRPGPQRA